MLTGVCHEIIVLLGSNSDDASEQMASAFEWLEEHITVTATSGVYYSPPFGGTGSDYLNRVVKGMYCGSIDEFEAIAKAREAFQGRTRCISTVTIDIDLISYDLLHVRPADMTREYFLQGMKELHRV